MRKHHSTRSTGRVTPPIPRRRAAGFVAGTAVAGSFLLTVPAGAAVPRPALPAQAGTRVSPAGRATTQTGLRPRHVGHPLLAAATTTASPLWVAHANGPVTSPSGSPTFGTVGPLNAPIVGSVPTPDGRGYWLVAADGGVFSFGDAAFSGSMGGRPLHQPIVAMAATPDGRGYWLVAADGGVFSFGDAAFSGSTGAMTLSAPVVGMAPTPSGGGYWLVAADGGVFSFGDAAFSGSTGAMTLAKPIVAMAATASGGGYWLLGSDGGVFGFGDAVFHGSLGSAPPAAPVTSIVADPSGGYWLADTSGNTYPFGPTGERPPMTVTAPAPGAAPAAIAPAAPVAFAEAQVGKPYAWGGTGPNSYDCSGLTQASWGAAGVTLARTAASQYADGTHVPVADAQPGDLIFWSSTGSPAGIYHVSIDLGNGMMVDAPHTGTTVTIEPIWAGVYPVATHP